MVVMGVVSSDPGDGTAEHEEVEIGVKLAASDDGDGDADAETGNGDSNGGEDISPTASNETGKGSSPSKRDGGDGNDAADGAPPRKININSHYGHRIGFLQTLSLTLNAGLMIYAHLGLSAVIYSSQDPAITADANAAAAGGVVGGSNIDAVDDKSETTGETEAVEANEKCNLDDESIWVADGGEANRPSNSNYCSREYNGGCFLNAACIEGCFAEHFGYSMECASCFGVVPTCSIAAGCLNACAVDSLGDECKECNTPCTEELRLCTGLPVVDDGEDPAEPDENKNEKDSTVINPAIGNVCNDYDLEAVEEWYTVYDLTFIRSIKDAWTGDAKLLAFIIVIFSGIWPYLKNIILVIIWYMPTTVETQTATLLWLSRLSKYTLVDVFAVIGVMVGVQLQLNVGGTEAITRVEPRFGIIAFFVATVWEFLQIEVIKAMHERKVLNGHNNQAEGVEERLYLTKRWIPILILVASLALYIAGGMSEIVYFESADGTGVCKRSYDLVSLGNALINELSLTSNSAPGQTWVLYLSYVTLNLAFPILVHSMQIIFLIGWFRSKKLKRLIETTLAIWCFACIEILLIGIFAVEYKFPNLILKIAGDANAGFLDIDSNLGHGFYILIAYSVTAGFLQWSLRIRKYESSQSSKT